jgi:hypothetical protein
VGPYTSLRTGDIHLTYICSLAILFMLHFVLVDSTAIRSPLNGCHVAMLPGCRMPGCVLEANHAQANHATRTNAIPVLCAHAKPGEFHLSLATVSITP